MHIEVSLHNFGRKIVLLRDTLEVELRVDQVLLVNLVKRRDVGLGLLGDLDEGLLLLSKVVCTS